MAVPCNGKSETLWTTSVTAINKQHKARCFNLLFPPFLYICMFEDEKKTR